MREAGHDWFADARANLLGHVAPGGTPQGRLIERMGISKQAVQQLIDGLVAEGILERVSDPGDNRARIVRHTERGRAAMADADAIKKRIEARYREELGADAFDRLFAGLVAMTEKGRGRT